MNINSGPYSRGRRLNWRMIKNALRLRGFTMHRVTWESRRACHFIYGPTGGILGGTMMTMEPRHPTPLTTDIVIRLIQEAQWTRT